MQEYQSIKRVYAEPMDRLVAEEKGLVRDIKNETEDGYIVVYEDDYTSWSPKDVFEKGYMLIEKSCLGEAVVSVSEDELSFMQKREKIIRIFDECKDELEKIKDENYKTGILINLSQKAEEGDIKSIIKLVFLTDLLEEK